MIFCKDCKHWKTDCKHQLYELHEDWSWSDEDNDEVCEESYTFTDTDKYFYCKDAEAM